MFPNTQKTQVTGLLFCSFLLPSLAMAQHSSLSGMGLLFEGLYFMILLPIGIYLFFANIGAATYNHSWSTFSMFLSWVVTCSHFYIYPTFKLFEYWHIVIAVVLVLSSIHLTYRRLVQDDAPVEE